MVIHIVKKRHSKPARTATMKKPSRTLRLPEYQGKTTRAIRVHTCDKRSKNNQKNFDRLHCSRFPIIAMTVFQLIRAMGGGHPCSSI